MRTIRAAALLLAAVFFLSAATWTIVRKDGGKIECHGPYAVVDSNYLFQDADGRHRSLPASEVDAGATALANRVLTQSPPIAVTRAPDQAPAANPENAFMDALRLNQWMEARGFREMSELLGSRYAAFERDVRLEPSLLDTFALFASSRAGLAQTLDEWVRQSPKSWIPFAARGIYLAGRGWTVRGTQFAYKDRSTAARGHEPRLNARRSRPASVHRRTSGSGSIARRLEQAAARAFRTCTPGLRQ